MTTREQAMAAMDRLRGIALEPIVSQSEAGKRLVQRDYDAACSYLAQQPTEDVVRKAHEALGELEELAVCGHNENAASRHTIRAIARIVRDYLAQPEGGDVEDEIAYGHFEVKEEDGRHFWFGAEDGWKDSDEIGEDGVLTIDAKHFAVGTVLAMSEPVSASTSRSALRSAKEREAAAVERTVEKAKAIGEEACKLYCRWYDHGVPSYMNGGAVAYEMVSAIRSILAALDSLRDGKE